MIEAYAQITFGVTDSNTHEQFTPFVPKLFEFLYSACLSEKTPVSFITINLSLLFYHYLTVIIFLI